MNASLEQMIIDAVSERGVAHQISAALIAGDTAEIGLIVRRSVDLVRKDYLELEHRRAEQAFDAKFDGSMDTLTGLTVWGKA